MVCENELGVKIHAETVHGNVCVVVSDSEEYGEVETLEQSVDELTCNGKNIKNEPVAHDSEEEYEDVETLEQSGDELTGNGRSVQNEPVAHDSEECEDIKTLEQSGNELTGNGRSVQNEPVAHDSEEEFEDVETLEQSDNELTCNGRIIPNESVAHESEDEYEDVETLEQSGDELTGNIRSVQNELVVHDSIEEYEDAETLEQSGDELTGNGSSVQNEPVAHDSEEEFEDVETLEQSGDELTGNGRSIKTKHVVHELDFLDDWEDGEVISSPEYWKTDEEYLRSNESKNKYAKFQGQVQFTGIKETIVEENDHFLRPTCKFCYATFSSFKAVEDHVKLLHEKTNYSNLKLDAPKQTTSISGVKAHSTTDKNASYIYSNKYSLEKAFKCNFCGLRKVSFNFIKKHTNTHKLKMSLQCKLCGSRFKRNSGIKIHQFKCRKITSAAKKCILCRFKFFNGTTLKKHFKNVHFRNIETNKTLSGSNKNTLKKFRCEQCGVVTEKGRLDDHESKHRIQRCLDYNICICCNKIFVDRVHLDIHTENMHLEWFSGKDCSVCKSGFPNNNSLKSHYLRYHITDISYDLVRQITDYNKSVKESGKDWKKLQGFREDMSDSYKHVSGYNPLLVYHCPIKSCMFQSNNHVLMKKHAIKHDKNYCHVCKSLFKNEIFDYHMKHHSKTFLGRKCTLCNSLFHDFIHLMYHKESTYQSKCNMCSQSFLTENLAQHMDKIHRKKSTRAFTCKKCQIMFQSKKSLNNHNKFLHCSSLHCRHCNKSFSSLKRLIVHKKIHIHKIKTMLKCTTCGKVCKSRDALKIHKARHRDSLKSQRCDTCLMYFDSFFELKEHVVSHLDNQEKKYFCDICEKGFYFYQCYRRHHKEH